MSGLTGLTDYYAALLAYQYRGQGKAVQQIKLWTKQAVGDFVAEQLLSCFDIDTAVGAQLDVIGKYVGVPRNIGLTTFRPLFSLWTYASTIDLTKYQGTWDPRVNVPAIPVASGANIGQWYVVSDAGTTTSPNVTPVLGGYQPGQLLVSTGATWDQQVVDNGNGLNTYSDPGVNINGIFYSYNIAAGQNADLTDEQFRTVVKLKAILNTNDSTLAGIMAYLHQFFPGTVMLVDNRDMTMNYFVVSTVPLSKELLTLYLPRPMGVGITVTIVSPVPADSGALLTEGGGFLTTEDGDHIVTEASP